MGVLKHSKIFLLLAAASLAACSTTSSDEATAPAASAPVAAETSTTETAVNPDAALLGTTVVYFDFDSDTIKQEAYEVLQAHAKYLAGHADAHVRLEGNADERGTREYNMGLGERRGNAVAKFLRVNGASDSQLEVISYGEEKPAVEGHDESAWGKNRRAEIVYTAGRP